MYRIRFAGLKFFIVNLSLFFSIFFMIFDMQGFKKLQKSPPPQIMGKCWSDYWLGKVLDSRPIAAFTEIFCQIGPLVREISSDKPFRTHSHVKLKKTIFLAYQW